MGQIANRTALTLFFKIKKQIMEAAKKMAAKIQAASK